LLHDVPTLMKVNVADALHFIAESQFSLTNTNLVNSVEKCGFSLNQTTDHEYAAELSITKVEWPAESRCVI